MDGAEPGAHLLGEDDVEHHAHRARQGEAHAEQVELALPGPGQAEHARDGGGDPHELAAAPHGGHGDDQRSQELDGGGRAELDPRRRLGVEQHHPRARCAQDHHGAQLTAARGAYGAPQGATAEGRQEQRGPRQTQPGDGGGARVFEGGDRQRAAGVQREHADEQHHRRRDLESGTAEGGEV